MVCGLVGVSKLWCCFDAVGFLDLFVLVDWLCSYFCSIWMGILMGSSSVYGRVVHTVCTFLGIVIAVERDNFFGLRHL
jgi:hypothetical protein